MTFQTNALKSDIVMINPEREESIIVNPPVDQFPDLNFEALPRETPNLYNAYFLGRRVDLDRLALQAGISVSVSQDGASITFPDSEISLKLAPTPEGKAGIWISGNPFISGYEGEDGDQKSKLLGEEGDLVVAGKNKILVISEKGTNPKNMQIPGTDTPILHTNASIIDAKGELSTMELPTRTIRDIFEEATTGVAAYPDY